MKIICCVLPLLLQAFTETEKSYGLRFVRVYPPHSPAEKFGIFTYVCSKRLRQIAQEKLSANEQAVNL